MLIRELEPREPVMEKNKHIVSLIQQSESVCVGVRRGDFLSPQNRKSFAVCTLEYYLQGRREIEKRIKNAKIIVVSDDIEWCRKSLWNDENTVYVPQDIPVYETFRLISLCKHFIISNSTFLWWGQYVSRSEKKIVIAPSRWNNDDFDSPLLKNDWILIEC